jgi:hypothetical protein
VITIPSVGDGLTYTISCPSLDTSIAGSVCALAIVAIEHATVLSRINLKVISFLSGVCRRRAYLAPLYGKVGSFGVKNPGHDALFKFWWAAGDRSGWPIEWNAESVLESAVPRTGKRV